MDAIERLGWDQLDRAALTLARAFASDPMFIWMFPNSRGRARSIGLLSRFQLEFGLRYGHATESNDGMATAVWIPPGGAMTMGRMVRCGLLTLPLRIGWRPVAKFIGAGERLGQFHTRYMREPHWYLMVVGVDPEFQGRGLGSALVEEGLARADQGGRACYLETIMEPNLAYYARYGFRVLGSAPIGADGPTGWALRREPRGLR